MRCLHTLRELVCVEKCRCARAFGSSDLRIDTSNHVIKREDISKYSDMLWVNKAGIPVPSRTGTVVRLHTSKANHQAVSSVLRGNNINGIEWKEVLYLSLIHI